MATLTEGTWDAITWLARGMGAIGIFEDGVLGNDQQGGTGTIKPVQNAVEEVKVLTTTLPAEYGHPPAGSSAL